MRKYNNPEIRPYDKKRKETAEYHTDAIKRAIISANYSKKESYVTPKSFFVIISGGEKREKDYFHLIDSNPDKFTQIKIEFIADSKRLNPSGLLENAKQKLVYYKSSETKDAPDAYFLLSDVDHFINDLRRIKPECEQLNLKLIISNPCFEVWLYYSKKADKFETFTSPTNPLQISSKVKNFLGVTIRGGCNPIKALFDIQTNIINAKKNYSEDSSGIPERFATNMFILAEKIYPFISEGLALIHPHEKQSR